MSYFQIKSLIALLSMAAGVTALVSMLTLMGRSERRLRVETLVVTHRASGYVFAALVAVAAMMGLRHLAIVGDSLPLRGVIHWVLAALLVVVVGLKIVIARFYRQFLKLMPVFGLIVFSLAVVVVVVSAVFFLITGGAVGAEGPTGIAPRETAGAPAVRESAERRALASGDASRGEVLFARHCSFCHNVESVEPTIGPGLANLLKRDELPSSGRPATPENVRAQLIDPVGSMPSFAETLSEEELNDLIAYLSGL